MSLLFFNELIMSQKFYFNSININSCNSHKALWNILISQDYHKIY